MPMFLSPTGSLSCLCLSSALIGSNYAKKSSTPSLEDCDFYYSTLFFRSTFVPPLGWSLLALVIMLSLIAICSKSSSSAASANSSDYIYITLVLFPYPSLLLSSRLVAFSCTLWLCGGGFMWRADIRSEIIYMR